MTISQSRIFVHDFALILDTLLNNFCKYLGQQIICSIPSAIGDSYMEYDGKDLSFTKYRHEHHAVYMSEKS
jgi:hypothetical protein